MNIGTGNREAADLPMFKVTCGSGRVTYTHDPGRALISGKCEDVGAIAIQQFRGLSARAPYFSNGTAATLREVVDYYDDHFHAGFTESEKSDLVNFLQVL
jgi:cytochrome c peroxidase